MQLFYQRFNVQEYLLFTLLGIASLVLLANIVGPGAAETTTDAFSIIISGIVMVFATLMVSKYGLKGNHGKAWILFMLFSAYWFCAESIDVFYSMVFETNVWEYADDFFYITGYQLLFASLVFYLRPFTKQISKKLLFGIATVSFFLLIPSLMLIINSDSEPDNLAVLMAYPILDSLVLIPALLGVVLFFKGNVNFMVTLLSLGIISQIVGDNSVLFLTLQNTHYPGHLAEVLFLWTYTMFAFGLANQFRLFNEKPEINPCPACGKTCTGHK